MISDLGDPPAGPGAASERWLAAHQRHAPRGGRHRNAAHARVRGRHLLHHVHEEPRRKISRSGKWLFKIFFP